MPRLCSLVPTFPASSLSPRRPYWDVCFSRCSFVPSCSFSTGNGTAPSALLFPFFLFAFCVNNKRTREGAEEHFYFTLWVSPRILFFFYCFFLFPLLVLTQACDHCGCFYLVVFVFVLCVSFFGFSISLALSAAALELWRKLHCSVTGWSVSIFACTSCCCCCCCCISVLFLFCCRWKMCAARLHLFSFFSFPPLYLACVCRCCFPPLLEVVVQARGSV